VFVRLLQAGFARNGWTYRIRRTYVRGTDIYPHMPIYVHTPLDFTNGASLALRLRWRISTVMFTCGWEWPARSPIRPILGFCGAKFTIMGDFLLWTPMNRRPRCDAAEDHILSSFRNTLATLWTLTLLREYYTKTFTDADFNHIHVHYLGQSDIISHFSILLMYNPLASCQAWY